MKAENKIYGYCRISTKQQSIERQIRNIKEVYPDAIIYKEAATGTKLDRPQWNKLIKQVKSGDTIIFDEVSRMSRNAEEGAKVYFELYNKNVNLVFLKESYINTEVYKKSLNGSLPQTNTSIDIIINAVSEYLETLAAEQIKIAFNQAQREIDYLHQRTKEGIETARRKGKQIGQKQGTKLVTKKSIEAKKKIKKYNISFGGNLNNEQTYKFIGLAKNTFYKYKAELLAETEK